MTEITPFPENNYETVLLDRSFGWSFFVEEDRLEPSKYSMPVCCLIPSSRN